MVTTRVNHNTIMYRYLSCTQCHCIVPAHYAHSVIHHGPIRAPVAEEPYRQRHRLALLHVRCLNSGKRGALGVVYPVQASDTKQQGCKFERKALHCLVLYNFHNQTLKHRVLSTWGQADVSQLAPLPTSASIRVGSAWKMVGNSMKVDAWSLKPLSRRPPLR